MDDNSKKKFRFIVDEGTPLLMENVIKGSLSKPLSYYDSLDEGIAEIRKQEYGVIEIPPMNPKEQMSYVMARIDSDKNVIINLITFGVKPPTKRADGRPYIIENNRVWQPGDTIYNTDYTINKVRGWVCIEDGVPGIWETFGKLGASEGTYQVPVEEGGGSDTSQTPTYTVSQSISKYEVQLPSAGESKLGKFILFAEDDTSDYDVYYCNRVIGSSPEDVSYAWTCLSQNGNSLKQVEIVQDENNLNVWILDRIGNYRVDRESDDYTTKLKNSCILLGKIPNNSSDNQVLIIGTKQYELKYDNENSLLKDDLEEGRVIILQYNPDNESTIYIQNTPLPYFNRKIETLSSDLHDNIEQLQQYLDNVSTRLNTEFTNANIELNNRLTEESTTLKNNLNTFSETITNDLNEFKTDINTRFTDKTTEIDNTISEMDTRFTNDINEFKTTTNTNMDNLRTEINQNLSDMTDTMNLNNDNLNQLLINNSTLINNKIDSDKTELTQSMNTMNESLLQNISDTNESLLQAIQNLSDKLQQLIDNQIILKGATLNNKLQVNSSADITDNLSVIGKIISGELIIPSKSSTTAGAIWIESAS